MKLLTGKGGLVRVLPVFEETQALKEADELFSYLKKNEFFKGSCGEVYTGLAHDGKHTIILGLGKEEELSYETIKEAFYSLNKEFMKFKVKSANMDIIEKEGMCPWKIALSIAQGLIHAEYAFEKYIGEKKLKPSLEEFYLISKDEEATKQAFEEAENIMEGVFLARDLTNEPAIVMTPKKLADTAREELEGLGVKVRVYSKKEIEELGMEAFLSVAKGSSNEPQFIVMEYLEAGDEETIALVGKGLTYDTGGYSLKPSGSMETMFTDMAGSAAVIGTMKAIAKSKLKKNVVALVAACENSVNGEAYKPGDIIGSMAGKTIEVNNTDAEGRLTLADALYFAATEVKADKIIDVATLTGACVMALSDVATGAITNDQEFLGELIEASKKAGEHVWELPNLKEFHGRVKGKRADLSNTAHGPRGAGTITAGLFLSHFVEDKPWVHLDIAGTSYLDTARGYLPQGASGIPVQTLYNLVKYY